MSVLYRSDAPRAAAWARFFKDNAPDIDFRTWPDAGDLEEIEYLVSWAAPAAFIASLPKLKVLFSSGAGIDHIDLSAVPDHVQIVRMVEPGIINGMVEYVTLSVLALHRDFFDYVAMRPSGAWNPLEVPPASSRTVGVMGLGVLGQAVLQRLSTFGFRSSGWNRSPKHIPGVACHAGAHTLDQFLGQCDILICLLPLTDVTKGILNARLFAALPRGASVINVGRGGHLDQAALLAALDSGHLSRAIVDVTEPEPLPPDHPFWMHPRMFVTPHVASMTQPETAAPIMLANLRSHMRGDGLRDVVDRKQGY